MTRQLPIRQCPHCGSDDLGVGWQQDQATVTYRRNGIFGNPVEHLICKSCGAILFSRVPDPRKYPPAKYDW